MAVTEREFPIQRFRASGARPRAMRAKGMVVGRWGRRGEYSSWRLLFSEDLCVSEIVYHEQRGGEHVTGLGVADFRAFGGWALFLVDDVV
jgi:hypothetical protein